MLMLITQDLHVPIKKNKKGSNRGYGEAFWDKMLIQRVRKESPVSAISQSEVKIKL